MSAPQQHAPFVVGVGSTLRQTINHEAIQQAVEHIAPTPPSIAHNLRAILAARRKRDTIFGADLFGEPAWDMILDLAAATMEGKQVSVTSLGRVGE